MKIKIKAGSIHNLSDARYFSTFAEWIGFNFDPSTSNALSVEKAREIMGWLAGPRFVGEFGDAPAEHVQSVLAALPLDTVQLTTPTDYTTLPTQVSSVLYHIPIDTAINESVLESIVVSQENRVAAFVLDFYPLQTTWEKLQNNDPIPLDFLADLCERFPIILSFPFTVENTLPIIEALNPLAINLVGGQEEKPGIRAFDDLDPIVELLEVEEEY